MGTSVVGVQCWLVLGVCVSELRDRLRNAAFDLGGWRKIIIKKREKNVFELTFYLFLSSEE